MFNNLLIPTDGSEQTEKVVERAAALAETCNANISILYVIDARALLPLGEEEQKTVAKTLEQEGTEALSRAEKVVKEADCDFEVTTQIAQGLPAEQIIGYAEHKGVDGIVIGSHGMSQKKQAIGSTTERVVRGINQISGTSILIVPLGDEINEEKDGLSEIPDRSSGMFQ